MLTIFNNVRERFGFRWFWNNLVYYAPCVFYVKPMSIESIFIVRWFSCVNNSSYCRFLDLLLMFACMCVSCGVFLIVLYTLSRYLIDFRPAHISVDIGRYVASLTRENSARNGATKTSAHQHWPAAKYSGCEGRDVYCCVHSCDADQVNDYHEYVRLETPNEACVLSTSIRLELTLWQTM